MLAAHCAVSISKGHVYIHVGVEMNLHLFVCDLLGYVNINLFNHMNHGIQTLHPGVRAAFIYAKLCCTEAFQNFYFGNTELKQKYDM